MRRFLLFVCLSVFSLTGHAQFWTEYSTGFPTASTGISRFDIVDENIAWGIGYNGINPSNNIQRFSRTEDGGLNWIDGSFTLGNVGLGIADISALSTQNAFIAVYPRASDQTGGVWKTEDAGVTWTKITSTHFTSSASFPNVLKFYDNGQGIVIGDPIADGWEIYLTSDAGVTFTRLNTANIPVPQANETGYLAQMESLGNSLWFTTNKGRIFHSVNRGANWIAYQSPVSDFGGTEIYADISFSNANKGILQTNAGVIYSTANSGASWTQIAVSGAGNPFGDNIAYIPGTSSVVSVGSNPDFAGSSYSKDDGLTWTNIDTIQHVDVSFFNLTTGYSGGFTQSSTEGGIFVYSDNVLTEGNFAFAKTVSLYPNPAQDHVNISGADSVLKLELINLSGQLIKSLQPSIYVPLDGLSTGLYFLKITTESGTETLPLIKK